MLNKSLNRYKDTNGLLRICYSNKYIGIDWKPNFFTDLDSANACINEIGKTCNTYVGIATYGATIKKNKGSAKNVLEITAHYLDIDNHLSPFDINKAKSFERNVLRPLYNNVIPEPSQVLFTGRGVQVFFNLKHATDTKKFVIVQKALCDTVQKEIAKKDVLTNVYGLKVDNLTDSARVLRVADTINTEAKCFSEVIYESDKTYTQNSFIEGYPNLQFSDKGKTYNLGTFKTVIYEDLAKATDNKLKFFKAYRNTYTADTINMYRRKDLIKLIELRNAKNYTQGYRNTLIAIMLQLYKTYLTDSQEIYNKLLDINTMFKEPLNDTEILNWCKSAQFKDTIYFKTQTIINKLGITEEEQQALKCLISKKISNARHYEKNKEFIKAKQKARYSDLKTAKKQAKEEKQEKRLKKILKLIEKGYTQKEIAKKLKVTDRTIRNILKSEVTKW